MKNGFTLIETLLYLALYAILMTGMLSGVYALLSSQDRDATSSMLEEEGDFLLAKIDWALTNPQTIEQPHGLGTSLMIAGPDGSTISFWSDDQGLLIQTNTGPTSPLNNADVSIDDLSFMHEDENGSQSVQTSFILYATTSDGRPVSREFSALTYLSP